MTAKTYIVLHIDSEWWKLNNKNSEDFSPLRTIDPSCTLITIQINDLIRYFKSQKIKRLPKIVDVECLAKQTQQRGKDEGVHASWSALKFLNDLGSIDSDFKLTRKTASEFMTKLGEAYQNELNTNLIEKKRYISIESPINLILYERQLKGIRIDRKLAKERCRQLENKIYEIKNILQLDYAIFDPENEKFQSKYIESKEYRFVQSLQYTLRTRRKTDRVCNLLYELSRVKNDLNSILIMLSYHGGREKVHPSFKGFGTITSRITMREPSIQNMKRTNRDIIVPNYGKEFCYIDYGQFEAGILASLSKDKNLIALYNQDIYTDIATKILGNKNEREEAKIIFYRFIYGDSTISREAKKYFERFKKLVSYIEKVNLELNDKGVIYSPLGNGRKKSSISSWALSHKIQSTASLIYKKSLLRAYNDVKDASFVIPMHDATLYEVSPIEKEETIKQLVVIYKEEFKAICPELEPIVTIKKFFEKESKSALF
jgi:DNA polymerase I-like protein with 3'-5' exonuclease and polymerase domains